MPLVMGIDVKELNEGRQTICGKWHGRSSLPQFGERPSEETLAMLDRFEQIAALLPIREETSRRVAEGQARRVVHLMRLGERKRQ